MTILGTPQVGSPPGPQCWAVDGKFVWVTGDHFTNQKLGNDGDSVFAEDVGFHWGRRQTYFLRRTLGISGNVENQNAFKNK